MQLINKTAYCTVSKNKLPTNSTKYPDIWSYPNFFITQRRTSRRKVTCLEPCELINRFDTTPTCDRQTDRQTNTGPYYSTRADQASPAIVLRRFLTQTTTTTVMTTITVSVINAPAITSVKSVGTPPLGSAA